jgi:hypothetical protein
VEYGLSGPAGPILGTPACGIEALWSGPLHNKTHLHRLDVYDIVYENVNFMKRTMIHSLRSARRIVRERDQKSGQR